MLYEAGTANYWLQDYHVIRYEKLQNGVKFVFRCRPGYCRPVDSGKWYIGKIGYYYPPTGSEGYIYTGLSIFGWSGVLWQEILIANTVTV